MNNIEQITVILCVLIILLIVSIFTYWYIKASNEVEKEKEEYNKSLFRYLNNLDDKIRWQYNGEERNEVIKEFIDISEKILKLDNNHSKIDNMRLIDSLAYHELNALKKVNKSLNVGVLLTDEKIQDALVEITKGLNNHYAEFCRVKTADVEEETYILKVLQQRELERLEFNKTDELGSKEDFVQ